MSDWVETRLGDIADTAHRSADLFGISGNGPFEIGEVNLGIGAAYNGQVAHVPAEESLQFRLKRIARSDPLSQ